MSLKKKDRIKKNTEIYSIIKNGKKSIISEITFYSINSEKNRLAIIIPKKKIKKAAKRNRIKRQIVNLYKKNKKEENKDIIIKINNDKNMPKITMKNIIQQYFDEERKK